jgi:tetratricopeptide (TPR) repeat protein
VQAREGAYAEARETVGLISQPWRSWRRSLTRRSIVETAASGGNFGVALETVPEIEDDDDRAKALATVAAAKARAGDRDGARATFSDALTLAWKIIDDTRDSTGLVEESRAQALIAIAEAQEEAGDPDEARATLAATLTSARTSDDMAARALALAEIGEVQAKYPRPSNGEALDFFEAALAAATKIREEEERPRTLKEIAKALARSGDWDGAVKTLADIDSISNPVIFLVIAAGAHAAKANIEKACEAAYQLAESIQRALTLAGIAKVQAISGYPEAATEAISSALASLPEVGEPRARDAVRARILRAQIALAVFAESLETVRDITDGEVRAEVLVDIAIAQAQSGERNSALQTLMAAHLAAENADNGDPRLKALAAVAAGYAQVGEFTRAFEIVQLMPLGYGHGNHIVRALAAIAVAQAQTGARDAARATFEVALKVVEDEPYEYSKGSSEGEITIAQAQAGLHQAAVEMAESLVGWRNLIIPAVVRTLVENGDRHFFKRLLIPCAYHRDATYQACGILAKAYSEQAWAIGRLVLTDEAPSLMRDG